MTSQGLGISGMATDDDETEVFNPLMFLADVAIQDAMQEASLQDPVVQDAMAQDTVSQDLDTKDTNTQDAGAQHTHAQNTARPDTADQEEAEHGSADSATRKVVTADEFLSMLADPPSASRDPSSSMYMESDDEDADDEDNITVKGEPTAKGDSSARKEKSAEERIKEAAARVESMTQQRAEEEQQVLKDMERDEAMNSIAAKSEMGSTSLEEIEATGILPEDSVLVASLLDTGSEDHFDKEDLLVVGSKRRLLRQAKDGRAEIVRKNFSIFSELSNYLELFMELAKHLRINDLVSLYAISKDFNETLNGHLSHILKACATYQAPESSHIFVFTLYGSLCIRDPVGRPDPTNPAVARMVPSLRWLRMVIHREKCVRDILACMAREGHRMPKTMSLSMKKMWLTMDIPTSARRVQLMHNEKYWTDSDLYNIQMLVLKLDMRFNDPIEGPCDDGLRKLMLGQRGLTPLCQLLKRTRFTDPLEVLEACLRYSYWPRPEHRRLPILGVPANEVGRGHLEGWGVGKVHLYRPDELVMRESCRRNMNLKSHIYTMIAWGYVDAVTGENIKVTREEMYMSDEDNMRKVKKKGELYGGGRKTKKGKGRGLETNGNSKEREKDKGGPFEEVEKSRDGEGDTHMAG